MIDYTNYFKRKLKTQQQIGLWVGLADAYGTEIAANAGYDWLLIDGEHAPSDLRTTLACAADQAAAGYRCADTADSHGGNSRAGTDDGESRALSAYGRARRGGSLSAGNALEQYS